MLLRRGRWCAQGGQPTGRLAGRGRQLLLLLLLLLLLGISAAGVATAASMQQRLLQASHHLLHCARNRRPSSGGSCSSRIFCCLLRCPGSVGLGLLQLAQRVGVRQLLLALRLSQGVRGSRCGGRRCRRSGRCMRCSHRGSHDGRGQRGAVRGHAGADCAATHKQRQPAEGISGLRAWVRPLVLL